MFNKFYWNFWKIILWTLFWYKIDRCIISYVIPLLFMIVPVLTRAHCSCLFSYQTVDFFFWKCSVHAHYNVCRTKTIATSPRYVMQKAWILVLWIMHLVIIFLQKRSYKAWQKIIQPKSKSMPKFTRHWNMHQFENVQRRKCFTGYSNKLQNQSANWHYLHLNVFSINLLFLLSSSIVIVILKYLFNSKVIKTIFTK